MPISLHPDSHTDHAVPRGARRGAPVRDPQVFAREVAAAMLRMRGWREGEAPAAALDDVFRTMDRHEGRYVAAYAAGTDPGRTAREVQNAEWDRQE